MSGQRVTESRHWCEKCQSETNCENDDSSPVGSDHLICHCVTCGETKDGQHG